MLNVILGKQGQSRIVMSLDQLAGYDPGSICCMDIETRGAEKLPGDSPFSKHHGIVGLAVCNLKGEAIYIAVNDGREPGVPVAALAEYCNANWLVPDRVVCFHNCKFDLGFLEARGFDFSRVKLEDTWLLHSLACCGVFVSNALKDIVQRRFGLDVDTQAALKKWLADHGTQDYGDIPLEILAPYTCDDVRYGLAVYLTLAGDKLDEQAQSAYRRHLFNTRAILAAERQGLCVDVDVMRDVMKDILTQKLQARHSLLDLVSGWAGKIDSDQEMLSYLAFSNLHPAARDSYGERKFVFDQEYLQFTQHPVALSFAQYYTCKSFEQQFGFSPEGIKYRVSQRDNLFRMHPSYWLTVFSKGGMVLCKTPNLNDKGYLLCDKIRKVFVPSPGHHFVSITMQDLPLALIAHYANDKRLADLIGQPGETVLKEIAKRVDTSSEAVSVLIARVFEGCGDKRTLDRLKYAGVRAGNQNALTAQEVRLLASIAGINGFMQRSEAALRNEKHVRDIAGLKIIIPNNKSWRTASILLNSGHGSVLSVYLSWFVQVARRHGARLVFVHEREMLFEAPGRSGFAEAARMSANLISEFQPTWVVREFSGGPWMRTHQDAHRFVLDRCYDRI